MAKSSVKFVPFAMSTVLSLVEELFFENKNAYILTMSLLRVRQLDAAKPVLAWEREMEDGEMEEGEKEEGVEKYCICRSTDVSTFMMYVTPPLLTLPQLSFHYSEIA